MTTEQIALAVSVATLVLQFWNAYTIASLKLWTTQNFVAKTDMSNYLSPLKEAVQMIHSEDRVRGHH